MGFIAFAALTDAARTLAEARTLAMPRHHDVRAADIDLTRLGAVLAPIGGGRPGQACVTVQLEAAGQPPVSRAVAFGDLVVLPLFVAELLFGRHMAVTPGNVAAIVSVALFSSVLAYIFWNQGVEQVGASVAGLFVHLMPVFGILLAWIFLGERLAAYHVAGIALILSGIGITSRLGRRPAPMPAGTD